MSFIQSIKEEINIIRERDPAIHSNWEVFLYPSFKAIMMYRTAHKWYINGHYFWARWLSQRAVRKTGIEIHPGAQIGKGLFIDHGSGVIIGETTIIGDNCTLYQGVTLGGTGKEQGKRHPTLGNNVMVSAGAKVLGSFTIGDNCKIRHNVSYAEHHNKRNCNNRSEKYLFCFFAIGNHCACLLYLGADYWLDSARSVGRC